MVVLLTPAGVGEGEEGAAEAAVVIVEILARHCGRKAILERDPWTGETPVTGGSSKMVLVR